MSSGDSLLTVTAPCGSITTHENAYFKGTVNEAVFIILENNGARVLGRMLIANGITGTPSL